MLFSQLNKTCEFLLVKHQIQQTRLLLLLLDLDLILLLFKLLFIVCNSTDFSGIIPALPFLPE